MKKLAALVLAFLIVVPAIAVAGTPTILDFHTKSCPPCKAMRPAVEALRKANYPVQSIDADQQPEKVERYGVHEFPTFLIVDERGKVLAKSKGFQPAKQLADLYNQVLDDLAERDQGPREEPRRQDGDEMVDDPDESTNPEPWKTIVRFQINDPHTRRIGFGSGTIIDSNEEESLILTCAHLFKIEGARRQYAPSDFPLEVAVEIFNGVGQGPNKTVLPIAKMRGRVVDYDFATDVALVKIKPGRRLPYSKVVPTSWQPKQGMKMTTVGCSLGNNPTAWTTKVLKPAAPGPDPKYRGMECVYSPKQGRSGGGIFTSDGYVAGVCDFASYTNTGLYARPESIHRLLDRNRLTALYNPRDSRDTLIARDKDARVPERGRPVGNLVADRAGDSRPITIPRPEMLGISEPNSSYETVGVAWKATPVAHPQSADRGPRVVLNPPGDDSREDGDPAPPTVQRTSAPATKGGAAGWPRQPTSADDLSGPSPRRVGEWEASSQQRSRGLERVER